MASLVRPEGSVYRFFASYGYPQQLIEFMETHPALGHEIGFGIGIAHGFATLGAIGFEGGFDYAAIRTVSNVASRLCDEAKLGKILVRVS
jgi:class 3 adenylate cyclase